MEITVTLEELHAVYDAIAARTVALLLPYIRQLSADLQELKTMSGTAQADIDAMTAQLGVLNTNLQTAVVNIQAAIAALPPNVNTAALDAAVAALSTEVDAVSAIAPAAPPAPPAP